jgi:chromosome segregation ATPase
MMSEPIERIAIVETKVTNLEEKMDDLQTNLRDHTDKIETQLDKMYEASCKQHAELGKEITEIKKTMHGWVMYILGGSAVIGTLIGLYNTFIK